VAEEEDDGAAWEKPSAMEQLLKMLGTSSSAAAAAPAKAKRSHNKEDEEDEEQDEEQEEEEETQRKRPAKKQRKTGELDKVDESVAEDDDDDESTEVDDGNEGDDKEEEEEEEEEQTDYFDVHFSDDATEEVQTSAELQASEGFKWHSQQYTSAVLGNVTVMETFEPDGDEGSDLGASEISPMADNLTTFSVPYFISFPSSLMCLMFSRSRTDCTLRGSDSTLQTWNSQRQQGASRSRRCRPRS